MNVCDGFLHTKNEQGFIAETNELSICLITDIKHAIEKTRRFAAPQFLPAETVRRKKPESFFLSGSFQTSYCLFIQ